MANDIIYRSSWGDETKPQEGFWPCCSRCGQIIGDKGERGKSHSMEACIIYLSREVEELKERLDNARYP